MAQENFLDIYDYIIVGGGLAGCVLGSRLRERMHTSSILIIEAGPDCVGHPLTSTPLACFGARKCKCSLNNVSGITTPWSRWLVCSEILGHRCVGWTHVAQTLLQVHILTDTDY
jgi:hypothetical protein